MRRRCLSDSLAWLTGAHLPGDKAGITAQMNAASVRGDIMFSRTTDGGQTWSPARDILGLNEFTNVLVVDRVGSARPTGMRARGTRLRAYLKREIVHDEL